MPVRAGHFIAVLLGVGCSTRVAVVAPPPYESGDLHVTLERCAYVGPYFGGSVHGTVENRTSADVNVVVILHLHDDSGSPVGDAWATVCDLGSLATARFEAVWMTPKRFTSITWARVFAVPAQGDPPRPEPRYK